MNALNRLRRDIILAAASAGEGHIPSAFSILDLVWVLYDRILCVDPQHPKDPQRDRFILSKGHGSLALYATLADKGFFPAAWLRRFSAYGGPLGGHPDCTKVPGVEASTGSLGHGLPMAVGMAVGMRIRKSDRRVFVLVGDGECNEGSIWESALLAAHHGLTNLTCIVDYNHSTDRALAMNDIGAKFSAFGWTALEVDGHSHEDICRAARAIAETGPTAIIARTRKGQGCHLMENNPAWHHRAPNADELPAILEELE